MVPHAIDRERGYCRGISLDFVLPLPRRNSFLPRESSGGLGRRLAGLAGTGTLAAEDSKHLPDTGDSRRDRFYPPDVLCWKASAKLSGAGLGTVEEIRRKACSIEYPVRS